MSRRINAHTLRASTRRARELLAMPEAIAGVSAKASHIAGEAAKQRK